MVMHIITQVPTEVPCSSGNMTAADLDRLVDALCVSWPSMPDLYRAQVALLHLARLMRGEG